MVRFLGHNKKLIFSIALNGVLLAALGVLLWLFYPQLSYELESVTSFGRYGVRTYRTDGPAAYFEILWGPEEYVGRPSVPRRIYSRRGEERFRVEAPGVHLTEKNVPYLVICQWSGSASGNGSGYRVLELDGAAVKEVAVIKGLGGVTCKDLDDDGTEEIVGQDEAYCFWGGYSHAGSPAPMVVLSFDESQGRCVVNKKLMAKPPLSEDEFNKLSAEYKNDPWWAERSAPPSGLFGTVFDLIYSGNEKQAWELLEASWADEAKFSRAQWKKDVEEAVQRSPFNPAAWRDLPASSASQSGAR